MKAAAAVAGYCSLRSINLHDKQLLDFWNIDNFHQVQMSRRKSIAKQVRGGRVEWNKDGCKRWLKATRGFLEKMAVAIHITYGQPARAEELGTVMVKNQVNGMRGIYWSRGKAMIVIGYNKTRSGNGKDKLIARFLPNYRISQK